MEIAFINDGAFALMKKVVPGPYTFIFEAKKKITKQLKASKYDHQVGIRFSPKLISTKVLEAYGDVVISSHVTHDMLGLEDDGIPLYSALIEDSLGSMIDLILDPGEYEFIGQTSILDFTSGCPEVVREGAGDLKFFI
jgi:tRNA A37 threonylcarbamoyladenosine synthetase subunit TsaC/SUA5/YrdC